MIDDLVSYWKLDEESGNAIDSHGSNTLSDVNGIGADAGKIGGARDLVRTSSQYFTKPDDPSLRFGDIDWTVQAWFKPAATATNMGIVSKWNSSNREFILWVDNLGRVRGEFGNGAGTTAKPINTGYVVSPGTWYHAIAWFEALTRVIGISVNGTDFTDTLSVSPSTGTAPFLIGAWDGGSSSTLFDGLIDEVGRWNRTLSGDERAALYNSGAGLPYPFSPTANATGLRLSTRTRSRLSLRL